MSERFEQIRVEISENDARIVAAMNERLRLVEELWRLKAELGIDRVDPEREQALRTALKERNAGPLSEAGLDELVSALLALTKRELG